MAYNEDMDEELLIALVREHRELYDCTLPRYSDVVRKEKIWKEIAGQVNQPVHKCKERWSNLRGSFRRAYRDHRYSIDVGERSRRRSKRWKYERQMEFLIPFLKNKYDPADLQDPAPTSDHPSENGTAQDDIFVKNEAPSSPRSFEANYADTSSILEDASRASTNVFDRRGLKRAAVYDLDDGHMEDSPSHMLMQYLVEKQSLESQQEKERENDVLKSFFIYLAETVKTFPPFMQIVAKTKCFNVISEIEMSLIKENPDQCVVPQISVEDKCVIPQVCSDHDLDKRSSDGKCSPIEDKGVPQGNMHGSDDKCEAGRRCTVPPTSADESNRKGCSEEMGDDGKNSKDV